MYHPADLPCLPANAGVAYFDVSGALVFHLIGRPELTSTSRVNRGECSRSHSEECVCVHVRLQNLYTHTMLHANYPSCSTSTLLTKILHVMEY